MTEKLTVHVIDDDDAVRDSLGILLEVEGFAVRLYPSGAAFLAELPADENCCLLVDPHMPDMDGLALLRQLRQEGWSAPAIVMTGRVSEEFRRAPGPTDGVLLEKPFRLGEIIGAIKAAVGSRAL